MALRMTVVIPAEYDERNVLVHDAESRDNIYCKIPRILKQWNNKVDGIPDRGVKGVLLAVNEDADQTMICVVKEITVQEGDGFYVHGTDPFEMLYNKAMNIYPDAVAC